MSWVTWQEIVCGLIIVVPVAVAAVLLVKVPKEPLRAYDLWAPCWSGVHPVWLFLYRGSVFVFMTFWFLRLVIASGISDLFFYTQWTFALVTIYFGIATCISARGCWINFKEGSRRTEEADEFIDSDLETNRTKIDDGIVMGPYDMTTGKERRAGLWGYVMQIVYQRWTQEFGQGRQKKIRPRGVRTSDGYRTKFWPMHGRSHSIRVKICVYLISVNLEVVRKNLEVDRTVTTGHQMSPSSKKN